MRLITYSVNGSPDRLGAEVDGRIVELPGDLLTLVQGGPDALAHAAATVAEATPELPVDEVRLKAPFRPGKIIGVGLNYVEHVEESSRTLDTAKELPDKPVLFAMPGTAITGQDAPILHNGDLTQQLDWECELAVIIGRAAYRVGVADALDHVFGYSVMNDISARDLRRSGLWFFSKGQDSYAPFGPAVITADQIPDPQALDLSLRVNGETKQKSNTRHMLFTVAQLIADISSGITLEPGDVIATGTPSGVGAGLVPQQFLKPGDLVEATVEGIGTLRNPVIDAR